MRGALQELQAEGHPATIRNVRDRLGRGSMTTVNKLIRQIAAEQAPELPLLELTNTDQDLIARLATRAPLSSDFPRGPAHDGARNNTEAPGRRGRRHVPRPRYRLLVNEVTMALVRARRAQGGAGIVHPPEFSGSRSDCGRGNGPACSSP